MKIDFNINNISFNKKFTTQSQNERLAFESVQSDNTNPVVPRGLYQQVKDECKLSHRNGSFPEVKKLPRNKFLAYKQYVQNKIRALGYDYYLTAKLDKEASYEITQNNIFIIDRVISNPEIFLENISCHTSDNIFDLANPKQNFEQQKAKCMLIDKLISHLKQPIEDYDIGKFCIAINDCRTIEEARIKASVLDRLLSDERMFENENRLNGVASILYLVSNQEELNKFNRYMDKIFSTDENKSQPLLACLVDFLTFALEDGTDEIADKVLSDEIFYGNGAFLASLCTFNRDYPNDLKTSDSIRIGLDIMDEIARNRGIHVQQHLDDIIGAVRNKHQLKVAKRILSDEKLYDSDLFMNHADGIISNSFEEDYADIKIRILDKITSDPKYYENEDFMCNIGDMLKYANDPAEEKIIYKILSDEKFYLNKTFMEKNVLRTTVVEENPERILSLMEDEDLTAEQVAYSIYLNPDEIKELNKTIGMDKARKLSLGDTSVAVKLKGLFGAEKITDIPIKARRNILKAIIDLNSSLYDISDNLKSYCPLIPINAREYCSIVPKLVKLVNVEPKKLSDKDIKDFYTALNKLSNALSKMSDKEFNELRIRQTYSKDNFITDVLDEIEGLEEEEKREIYNYFNFELEANDRALTNYAIVGYPSIPTNKKPYPKQRQKAKNVEKYIIKFNKDNHAQSNNPEIKEYLDKILNIFPELRLLIGKLQAGNIVEGQKIGHGSHAFDVFKHSLKVMQKISQDCKFNKSNSQNVLLLASLFHDITKSEGYTTPEHPETGSIDTYFITKKLGLSSKSEYKLYTLIKNHEWLRHANRFKNEKDLNERLESIAYNLRHDDMLDLALIFTHADLKAVRANDSFHDETEGKLVRYIDGKIRSNGEAANIYAGRIKELTKELQKSQPLLPVTKFPKASRINEVITKVNEDGSTNIKGVYKDKDGLIVVNYNEVEDWEAIGFSKGTISKGIKFKTPNGKEVNTGNIKFFAHGLEYKSQLVNFDAFLMPDSDVLLSASYAELPESKFRFFRPQGVILDCDTINIHAGGHSDSGSGTKKTVKDFMNFLIFSGYRKGEREYISELIKKGLHVKQSNYINFIQSNENKEPTEILPKNSQTDLIKIFGSINSNIRIGERSYNEFYISNPKIMAVYAYGYVEDEHIANPVEFLNRKWEYDSAEGTGGFYSRISTKIRTNFLRNYALSHDLPFVVFSK